MSTAVEINGLSINSGDYRVREVQHDSSPPMRMNTIDIARQDGTELVSSTFAPKRIQIDGIIRASTHNALVEAIDELKKYCLKDDLVNLDIQYGAATRRYQVQVENVPITLRSYNVTFAPFSIICFALEEPMGRATTWSEAVSVNTLTNEYETFSPTFLGSAPPKPKLTFYVEDDGGLEGIYVYNRTTNTRLETSTVFTVDDILEIDCDSRDVTLNDESFSYKGIFPEFEVGENSLEVNFQASGTINIQQTKKNFSFGVYRNRYIAQCIKPGANLDVPKLEVRGRYNTKNKTNTEHDLILRIETDNAGEPSGTLVSAGATVTIPYANITQNLWQWFIFDFATDIALTSGTNYWIVLHEDNTGSNRCIYQIGMQKSDEYTDSDYPSDTLYSWNGAANWATTRRKDKRGVGDLTFSVYDRVTANWDIDFNTDYKQRYY